MTTYKQGRAPEGAPVTWYLLPFSTCVASVSMLSGNNIDACTEDADAIGHAFHLAKLAEDYVRACDSSDELRDSDPFVETAEGIARAKACDAARDAMVKAVRA